MFDILTAKTLNSENFQQKLWAQVAMEYLHWMKPQYRHWNTKVRWPKKCQCTLHCCLIRICQSSFDWSLRLTAFVSLSANIWKKLTCWIKTQRSYWGSSPNRMSFASKWKWGIHQLLSNGNLAMDGSWMESNHHLKRCTLQMLVHIAKIAAEIMKWKIAICQCTWCTAQGALWSQ